MPRPLPTDLVTPSHTAIVTQECQNGVIGPEGAAMPELAEIARREAIPNIARLVDAGRAAGVQVIHCTVQFRPDRRGSNHNAPIFGRGAGGPGGMTPGSPGASVLTELGPADTDLVLTRSHGLGPMGGTELDATLRNLGVTTIVGVGVSVNVAMTNFAMDAVNAAYDFVLPRDAVAGIPAYYADAVIKNTLSFIATITTTDDLIAAWS